MEWFGVPLERSTPLPLDRLKFPWCRYARSGITVGELLARETLRPDLLRVRRVYEAGRGEEASLMLGRLLAEGDGAAYQTPAAIVGDRSFAYSLAEVEYVDPMADYLLDRDQTSPREFVLSTVAGLYVSPRPFAYAKARVALQRSACSLMRLHHVSIAPHDWAAYRHSGEADGHVFRSASFKEGLSPSDFPRLPEMVRVALPSLGVYPLLPYILKQFGVACADWTHPAYDDLIHNVEREWAWALGNAFLNEVSIHGRVFVQPTGVLAHLGRVAWSLPSIPLHPLERSTPHVPWNYAFVLELMHRAYAAGDRHLRHWNDFTTGSQASFLLYDHKSDAFVTGPAVPAHSYMCRASGGGVGSASRLARRKRHHDLDSGHPRMRWRVRVRGSPVPEGDPCTTSSPPKPPVPPLSSTLIRASPAGAAVCRSSLEWGDVCTIPVLAHALRDSAGRAWQVESLLHTLSGWYMARSTEARRLESERAAFSSQLRRTQSELEALRESSQHQANSLERAVDERERYRREGDALRALRVAPAPRPTLPDPYAGMGYVTPCPAGRATPVSRARPWSRHGEVAMPPLDALEEELPRHPSYCPSSTYGPGATAPSNDTHR